jgi:hypothetical protein
LRGPNFHAAFEVPVFKLPEPPAISDDPTVQYQMSLDEIRQTNPFKNPGQRFAGRRQGIHFPRRAQSRLRRPARPSSADLDGVIILLLWKHAPPLFPLVFGAADLLMTAFVFDLWFRRSRVVIATPAR